MGLSYQQIVDHLEELYGFTLSPSTLTSITDKIIPELNAWRNRDLEKLYCFMWLDALFYKVRDGGKVINKAMYNIIGVDANGSKDLLGVYLAETEGSAFWMQVLEDLKRRGLEDVLIVCIDNLKGFEAAIHAIFPKAAIQSCVVHQIRNTMRFVPSKHKREFIKDLKSLYTGTDKIQAEGNLSVFKQKWGTKYPLVIDSWERNWDKLTTFYSYPNHIRKIMYTTNIIEGFHRQVRRVTKVKSAFTNDMAFLKLVYLATKNITEKWVHVSPNWGLTLNQLSVYFPDRIKSDQHLTTY